MKLTSAMSFVLFILVSARYGRCEGVGGPATWGEALRASAKRLGLKFTIELSLPDPSSPPALVHPVRIPESLESKDKLLNFLRQHIPTADILVDESSPDVVHIIQKGILEDKTNFLNKNTSIRFQGPLGDLMTDIQNETNNQIRLDRTLNLTRPVMVDRIATPSIDVKDKSYRTILSLALDSEVSDAVVWTAFRSKSAYGSDAICITFYTEEKRPEPTTSSSTNKNFENILKET